MFTVDYFVDEPVLLPHSKGNLQLNAVISKLGVFMTSEYLSRYSVTLKQSRIL